MSTTLARVVGDATVAARSEGQLPVCQVAQAHQPEFIVLDFVSPKFSAAFSFQRSPLFGYGLEGPQRLQLRNQSAFQRALETILILVFANTIFLFRRISTPQSRTYSPAGLVTVIPSGQRPHGSRGWQKREPCGPSCYTPSWWMSVATSPRWLRNQPLVQAATQGVSVGRARKAHQLRPGCTNCDNRTV